jgi:hypothetical protein
MDDTPMMAQGLRYNWEEPRRPLVPDQGQPGKRPQRQCWRFWSHHWHLCQGRMGNEPTAVCPGVPFRKTGNERWR